MREEKKYLVEAVDNYLGKSNYLFVTNFQRVTVPDIAELRQSLSQHGAEFHVVKNRILKIAAKSRNYPEFDAVLTGQTAIVVGGDSPSEVAKIIVKFNKDKEKCELKAGVLSGSYMSPNDIDALSKLPSLDVLRAQLLSLFNTPAQRMVRVMQAVPEGMLNVLQARSKQES